MFKKPLGNLKTYAPIRSSDRRKLKQKVVATYNLTNEDGDLLVPDGLQSAKYATHTEDPGVSTLPGRLLERFTKLRYFIPTPQGTPCG